MEKKEVHSYRDVQQFNEFTSINQGKSQSEFNQNSERFYHDDEFNRKADFRTSRFKLKKKAVKADSNIIESLQALIKPLVIALSVTVAVVVPTVIRESHHHSPSDWIIDVPATCTQVGSRHVECLECGAILKTEEIPLAEHQFSADFIVEKEATCTEEGYEVIRCTVCGLEKERRVIEMLEHVPSEVIVDLPATCTEEGHQHIECLNCGLILSEENIAAAGHKYGSWKTTRSATCSRTGIREHTCSVCGEKETETIAKIKHYFVLNDGQWGRDDCDFIYCRYCLKGPFALGFLVGEYTEYYEVQTQSGALYQRVYYH